MALVSTRLHRQQEPHTFGYVQQLKPYPIAAARPALCPLYTPDVDLPVWLLGLPHLKVFTVGGLLAVGQSCSQHNLWWPGTQVTVCRCRTAAAGRVPGRGA